MGGGVDQPYWRFGYRPVVLNVLSLTQVMELLNYRTRTVGIFLQSAANSRPRLERVESGVVSLALWPGGYSPKLQAVVKFSVKKIRNLGLEIPILGEFRSRMEISSSQSQSRLSVCAAVRRKIAKFYARAC